MPISSSAPAEGLPRRERRKQRPLPQPACEERHRDADDKEITGPIHPQRELAGKRRGHAPLPPPGDIPVTQAHERREHAHHQARLEIHHVPVVQLHRQRDEKQRAEGRRAAAHETPDQQPKQRHAGQRTHDRNQPRHPFRLAKDGKRSRDQKRQQRGMMHVKGVLRNRQRPKIQRRGHAPGVQSGAEIIVRRLGIDGPIPVVLFHPRNADRAQKHRGQEPQGEHEAEIPDPRIGAKMASQ